MWLINATTYRLEEYVPEQCPPYAILSHRWQDQEVAFRDIASLRKAKRKKGFSKIKGTCRQAFRDGYQYAWVDTCCINKESSSELSEAINSMFNWYKDAQACYVYLCDVTSNALEYAELSQSLWFTRGWTLQELIAPKTVRFYNCKWELIGEKSEMIHELHAITGIGDRALSGIDLIEFSIATRMSWASKRKTTRKEDTAYCLLGICGVNMPLLYGEGERAFLRLQEEVLRRLDAGSLIVWHRDAPGLTGLLATSPADFADVVPMRPQFTPRNIVLTNRGISLTLYLQPRSPGLYWAYTGYRRTGDDRSICLLLYRPQAHEGSVWTRVHVGAVREHFKSIRHNWVGWENKSYSDQLESRDYLVVEPRKYSLELSRDVLERHLGFEVHLTGVSKGEIENVRYTVHQGSVSNPPPETIRSFLTPNHYGIIMTFESSRLTIGRLAFGYCHDGLPFLIGTNRNYPNPLYPGLIDTLISERGEDRSYSNTSSLVKRNEYNVQRLTSTGYVLPKWQIVSSTSTLTYGPDQGWLWALKAKDHRGLTAMLGLKRPGNTTPKTLIRVVMRESEDPKYPYKVTVDCHE